MATNGEWISLVYNAGPTLGTNFMLFRVSEDGTISDMQHPDRQGFNFFFARFLSDGTVIAISSNANQISVPRLLTFKLVNGTWTLVDISILDGNILTAGNYCCDRQVPYTLPIFALTDTHFIATDNTYMYIYTRLVNGSWTLDSKFQARGGKTTSISWNGVDAILTGMAENDQFVLYQKSSNGIWDGSVVVKSADVGYTGTTNFGISTLAVNTDTFLVLAPNAQDAASDIGGRILMLQRFGGQWYLAGQLLAQFTPDAFNSFSKFNIVANDRHVLFPNNTGVYSLPLCMFEPLQYQCQSQISLDTCNFGDFEAGLACNSTQTDCGAHVNTIVNRLNFGNNQVTIDFSLNRFGAMPLSQSVSIQCKELSSVTPSSSPTSAPNFIPVANSPGGGQVTSTAQYDHLVLRSDNLVQRYVLVEINRVIYLSIFRICPVQLITSGGEARTALVVYCPRTFQRNHLRSRVIRAQNNPAGRIQEQDIQTDGDQC